MAIKQTEAQRDGYTTIICTRDKDLRQVTGWHYGWELGNQPEYGPFLVEGIGHLTLSKRRDKLLGSGTLFFYAQCLTGDGVDSIPGLPGCGPVKAYQILEGKTTEEEAFQAVYGAYQAHFGEDADKELLEQGRLLWMTRQLNEDGNPVLWELPFNIMNKDGEQDIPISELKIVPITLEPMKENLGSEGT